MPESEYEVVLLRHGETVGYDGDLGLTALGEQQARDRGTALAAEIKPGTTVRMPHARTARGVATAVALRAALVEALGGERVDGTEIGPLYPEPWFDNLRYSLHGQGVDTSDAVTARLALPDGDLPDWAREYDRFDSDYGARWRPPAARSSTGCTTRRSTSSHRTWPRTGSGAAIAEAGAGPAGATCSSSPRTHSAPMRAFVATALGAGSRRTPQPRGHPGPSPPATAPSTVVFRDHTVRHAGAATAAAVDRPGLVRVVRALTPCAEIVVDDDFRARQMLAPSGGTCAGSGTLPASPVPSHRLDRQVERVGRHRQRAVGVAVDEHVGAPRRRRAPSPAR